MPRIACGVYSGPTSTEQEGPQEGPLPQHSRWEPAGPSALARARPTAQEALGRRSVREGGEGGLDAGDPAPCKTELAKATQVRFPDAPFLGPTEPLPYLSSRSAWKLGLGPVTESLAPGTATHLTRRAPAHKRLGGQACLDLTAEPIWNQPLTQPRAVVDAPGSTQPCPPHLPRGSLLPDPPPRSVSSLRCDLAGPRSHSP